MKLFLCGLLLILLAGCAALSPSGQFEIKVTGQGPFSGSIMVIRDGKSEQRSVDGQAPTSYQETGTLVSVCLQKKGTQGTLGVEILRNGQTAASQSTSADYGVVTAATQ